jgi:hypothetical protein
MNTDLRAFLRQYAAVVAMALLPVVMTAFVSMPYTLGRHPGERVAVVLPSTPAVSVAQAGAPAEG